MYGTNPEDAGTVTILACLLGWYKIFVPWWYKDVRWYTIIYHCTSKLFHTVANGCTMVQIQCTMVYHNVPWYNFLYNACTMVTQGCTMIRLQYTMVAQGCTIWYGHIVPWYTTVYCGIPWLHHGCTMVLFHKGNGAILLGDGVGG